MCFVFVNWPTTNLGLVYVYCEIDPMNCACFMFAACRLNSFATQKSYRTSFKFSNSSNTRVVQKEGKEEVTTSTLCVDRVHHRVCFAFTRRCGCESGVLALGLRLTGLTVAKATASQSTALRASLRHQQNPPQYGARKGPSGHAENQP